MKALLVGELNPYGDDDHFALYPRPERASGHRLCTKVMGLKEAEYLRRFDRKNLCCRRWSLPSARANARAILAGPHQAIVMFGAKVTKAFGFDYAPFTYQSSQFVEGKFDGKMYVILPHPSGLCRAWNEPGAFDRARSVLREAGVL